ncbi:MAG TPA: glycosyltransferase [Terriglobales bacterium]|nr:glycosyltransferase [Terriglobales bacterium]
MQTKTAVLTIVAKNHLAHARCLMESVRRLHPEFLRAVVLADRIDWLFSPAQENFGIVLSEDLQIPASEWFHFQHSLVELTTGLRPYALEWVFQRFGVENVIYLDADTKLYAPLSPLLEQLREASIVLTPHLTAGLNDFFSPSEADILWAGAYNLGFLALRANFSTFAFLRWWQNKVHDRSFADASRSVAAGQRWMDLAPGLFDGVVLNREPGYNVGYWNLNDRKIRKQAEGYSVNGSPLYFFHFSGFDPDQPALLSRRQNRFQIVDLGDGQDLVEDYRQDLFRNGYTICKSWPYAYGAFRNGIRIPDIIRRVPRASTQALLDTRDPFSAIGFDSIGRYWNDPQPDRAGGRTRLTRLAYHYYLQRPDLQAAMPDVLGRDQGQFLEWLMQHGVREVDWGETFFSPLRSALAAERAERSPRPPKNMEQRLARLRAAIPATLPPACRQIVSEATGALIALFRRGMTEEACVTWLNETVATNGSQSPLTRLAQKIYESRPDLKRSFPDPAGADAEAFTLWFLTYARVEFHLDERFLAPFRTRRQHEAALGRGSRHIAARTRFARMAAGARLQARLSPPSGLLPPAPVAAAVAPAPQPAPELAFNLTGYAGGPLGIGDSARSVLAAARACDIPVRFNAVPASPVPAHRRPTAEDFPFPFHLVQVNPDSMPGVIEKLGAHFFAGRSTIGCWDCELDEFPEHWADCFHWVREVWTPTGFSQDVFSRKSPVPVVRIPYCIQIDTIPSLSRAELGLPRDKFLFLTFLDLLDSFARQNPLAVAEAFRLAFPRNEGCHLVVQVQNAHARPDLMHQLRESCASLRASVIDRAPLGDEVAALMQACDCLVSLHRSERFGFRLAESMYLGKPVIATAYSGNLEFTHPGNSFLVSCRMCRVGPGNDPYPPGAWWAEPSVAEAVQHMKTVVESAGERHKVAQAGRSYVREHLSATVMGRRIRERLAQLAARS